MPEPSYQAFLNQPLSFAALHLHLIDLPQKQAFSSGIGQRKSRQALIVEWIDAEGRSGFGESSCRPDPYYSAEFLEAAVPLIQHFVVPQLRPEMRYRDLLAILARIRGWPFTKTAVEAAAHDLISQKHGATLFDQVPLPKTQDIPVGISIGIQDSVEQLAETITSNHARGYRRLKFKISPTSDTTIFEQVRSDLEDVHVSFDANGTFLSAEDPTLRFFQSFGGAIEQPFPPDRIDLIQAARVHLPDMRICLDEEVKSLGGLMKAHQLGALDELNLKIGRVGGLTKSLDILHYCHQHDIPCWIGGMFETGIGRRLNLEFAAFLPQAQAHDLSPSSRYFVEDIILPDIRMATNGTIDYQQLSALKLDRRLLEKYTYRKVELSSS